MVFDLPLEYTSNGFLYTNIVLPKCKTYISCFHREICIILQNISSRGIDYIGQTGPVLPLGCQQLALSKCRYLICDILI